jgi:ornithine--oxo-acid transaminase
MSKQEQIVNITASQEYNIDAMTTQDYINLENEYGAHNYHPLDVVIENAKGA